MRAYAKQAVMRQTAVVRPAVRSNSRVVRTLHPPKAQPAIAVRPVAAIKPSRRFIAPTLLFCALICQLYVRVSIIENGYQAEELRRNILSADEQLRQLQLDQAYITRPQRLSEIARNSFGLVRTAPDKVRIIDVAQ